MGLDSAAEIELAVAVEAWDVCRRLLILRIRDELLVMRDCGTSAIAPLSPVSFGLLFIDAVANRTPPPPGAGKSLNCGSYVARLAWKSSKLTEGRKS
jgi:hypothetical protein